MSNTNAVPVGHEKVPESARVRKVTNTLSKEYLRVLVDCLSKARANFSGVEGMKVLLKGLEADELSDNLLQVVDSENLHPLVRLVQDKENPVQDRADLADRLAALVVDNLEGVRSGLQEKLAEWQRSSDVLVRDYTSVEGSYAVPNRPAGNSYPMDKAL